MKSLLTTFYAIVALIPFSLHAQLESNIVIADATETYTLVPDKSGTQIAEIKQTKTYSFVATRAPGNALDYVFYDSFTKVDKAGAKAKGVRPVYQSAISAGIFYDDSKICAISFPIEEINKPVRTHFELTNTRPDLEPLIFLGANYPVTRGSITITMPVAFKDRYDIATANLGENVTVNRSPSTNGRDWVFTINYHNMPRIQSPDDAPPPRHIFPTVQFIGRFANPQELYGRLSEFARQSDPDPGSVTAKAIEITAGCGDDLSRAEAIFNWVNDNIRYIAIEHGDLGHTPDHPSQVLAKRYGDCKGSANLIKAMLRAVNLDGRLVWLGTDRIPDDYTDRPVFATGNHMIAALKLPGDSIIYLDGTVGLTDFGHYTPSIQGKQTIVEDGDNCIVGRVPTQPATTSTDSTRLDLTLDAGQTLTGTFTETLTGQYKASLLNNLRDTDPHQRAQYINKYITLRRPSWKADSPTFTNDAPGNGPMTLASDITISRSVKQAGSKTYLTLDLAPWLQNMQIDTKEKRQYPGWLGWRRHITTEFNVALPSTLTATTLPQSITIDNDNITASITYTYDPDTNHIGVNFRLTVNERLVPLDKIESYNADIKRLINAANTAFTLNTSQP